MKIRRDRGSVYAAIAIISLVFLFFTIGLFFVFERKELIIISEICAYNKTAAYDDNGLYGQDYVEIYNYSDHDMVLTDYYLSDDRDDYKKYELKDVILPANATVIIWCGENIDNVEQYNADYRPRDYHQTSFALHAGETVYLSHGDKLLQSIRIPEDLSDNKVYSNTTDNLEVFQVMEASPYYIPVFHEEKALLADNDPVFSIESGWYDEPFYLELECPEGEIYYTTDGSIPDENSNLYTGKIYVYDRSDEPCIYAGIENISLTHSYLPENVMKATVIKAIAITEDTKSEVVSRTYFVGINKDPAVADLSVMEITVDPDDLFDYYNGIYMIGNVYDTYVKKYDTDLADPNYIYTHANYAMEGKGWERPAKIEYFGTEHNLIFSQDIGIRIHGGFSTSHNQKGFNLYAREIYDGNSVFGYSFWGKNYNKMMLRTGGDEDSLITKMRDVLNQKLVEDRNLGIQKATPCVVFINGEYWGLYNLQETIGNSYVSEKYGVDSENIVIMKNEIADTKDESQFFYTDLLDFVSKNDLSIDKNYRYVERMIDIQSYIDYMAFEIYIANGDSMGNNYAGWRTISPEQGEYGDCKWRFLLYDTDDSTGLIPHMEYYTVDSFISGHWTHNPLGDRGDLLFSSLMRNEEFKQRFVVSFMDIANNNFDYEKVTGIISEMAEEYKYGVIASQERFRGGYEIHFYSDVYTYAGEYTEEVFNADVRVIDDFYANRYNYIVEYMKTDLNLEGNLYNVELNNSDLEGGIVSINTINDVGINWKGRYYSDYPIEIRYKTEPGYTFIGWFNESGEIISEDNETLIELTSDISLTAVVEKNR